jgi:transcriptional regulator with XRE-family HTH domain
MSKQFEDIGNRLRAYRLGRNLTADEIARRINVSRAAVYRLEQGTLKKIETLERVSELLDVPLPSLMGVGVEYYNNAVAFFERMRQLEDGATRVVGNWAPVSLLLLSDDYLVQLRSMLLESLPASGPGREEFAAYAERVLAILRERKAAAGKRHTAVISLTSVQAIERFLRAGLVGRYGLKPSVLRARRAAARREVERLVDVVRAPPNGIEVGLVDDLSSDQTFQIFEKPDATSVTLSPYRLGDHPNISTGIAMATSAPDAVRLFRATIEQEWKRAQTGARCAKRLKAILKQVED